MTNEPQTPKQTEKAEEPKGNTEKASDFTRRENAKWTDIAIVILTGGIVLAAILQTIIFYMQRNEMHSAGEQTDRIICAALQIESDLKTANAQNLDALTKTLAQSQAATNASNAQSEKVLNANIAAARLDQRAWVGVMEATGQDFSVTNGLVATITFINSGRTPARKVQVGAGFFTSSRPVPGPPSNIQTLEFRPAQSIGPQQKYHEVLGTFASGEPYTETQLRGEKALISRLPAIKSKELILYYYGVLKYEDIFGNSRQTQFCLFLANPDTKQLGFCDSFNDMN
jgi:hypothetical protein